MVHKEDAIKSAQLARRALVGATITDVDLSVVPVRTETGQEMWLVVVNRVEVGNQQVPYIVPDFYGPATEMSFQAQEPKSTERGNGGQVGRVKIGTKAGAKL
jgi:hypothetical protein